MIYQDRHPPYFLCLCSAERQPLLAEHVARSPHRVEFVEQVEEVLVRGLDRPPLALLLEISTAIRFGAERMSRFLNLGVSWPVMRCVVGPDGDARVMCFEPPHGEALLPALDAIAAGDPSWQHPRFQRRHLRLHIPGRARVRVLDEERWRVGNLMGISCGGCFIAMTSDAPRLRDAVELEAIDFPADAQHVRGTVVWTRTWEESLEIPGVGIEFDPATVSETFRRHVTQSPQLSSLIAD